MGSLTALLRGPVYVDANILIYTVERVAPYAQMLDPLWQALTARRQRALTSELAALETLVGPLRAGDATLETLFRRVLFRSPTLHLIPISTAVLERAAQLRAQLPALKTPDAIHVATALEEGAATFLTNDGVFRQVPGLNVIAPHDLPIP